VGHRDWDVFEVLEGQFAAAIAAEDALAGADLAFSLAQDVPVIEEVFRDGGRVRVRDVDAAVTSIGHDFLQAGSWLIPLDRAVLTIGHEAQPVEVHDVLLARLRREARAAATVAVGIREGTELEGWLERVTPTHLVLRNGSRCGIPLAELDYLRLVRGDSTDAV